MKTEAELLEIRKKKKVERTAEENKILVESLSIRQRLENKLETDVIKLKFEDDLGEFVVGFKKTVTDGG